MKKIELNIIALANSESQEGNFVLILEEQHGFRRLPIIIGPFEAQAIAISLEKILPNRPMTHDLFKNSLEALGVSLKEVQISDFAGSIFHSTMIAVQPNGREVPIDSRTSDAIAMAVRFGCPIYTSDEIMREAGIVLDNPTQIMAKKRAKLSDYSREELELLLEQVLAEEDYESAVKIRNVLATKPA